MNQGHVFVLRGKIGEVVSDAVIIPTDRNFRVEDQWATVIKSDSRRLEPRGWKSRGWGRGAVERADLWFLDVVSTGDQDGPFDRLTRVFADIAAARITPKHGRRRPLVVLPTIGTSGGGMRQSRGQVVRNLLDSCLKSAIDHDLDIAIVTPTASTYAALQHERRDRQEAFFRGDDLAAAKKLGERAASGSLALLIAAGVSMGSGAPSWHGLIGALVARTDLGHDVQADLEHVSVLDQAQLLQEHSKDLTSDIRALIAADLTPSVAHALLAGLDCQAAVTTNYDDLYERAVRSSGDRVITVLPHQLPDEDSRWVLKMHGDRESSELVLTRSQFVDFTGSSGPAGSVLQALLLTRHLLIVGASMTDDNLLRLIYEVDAFRSRHQPEAAADGADHTFGTVLYVGDSPAREALHRRHFTWQGFGSPNAGGPSKLEIFLDAVAMFAADDGLWLLDEDFAYLIPEEDRGIADEVRLVHKKIQASENAHLWAPLRRSLLKLGARADRGERAADTTTATRRH